MKALFIGLGSIGQRHLRNLRRLRGTGVKVSAYRVRKLSHVFTDTMQVETENGLEQKYGVEVFDNLPQALDQRPDIVFVCNPNSLHLPAAMAAAKAGCHIFIEKPLSHNEEGVDELIELVEAKGLVATVGYQLRFHPCFQRLQDLLSKQAIGRVLAVRSDNGEYMPGWHPYEDYRATYAAKAAYGGGVILCQIHDMDYLFALFGTPRRIFALGGHLSDLEIEVEDVAGIAMEFAVDGRGLPVQLHLDFIQRPPSRTCEVVGETGKIKIDWRMPGLQWFDNQGKEVERQTYLDFQRNQMFLDEMTHFLACVEKNAEPVVTLRDGAQSLKMALAAKQSLATGQVVELGGVHE